MELSKNFEPGLIEQKWYTHWLDKGYFQSIPDDRKPYTVVMPPPNVTGILHMGHCLNNTIQDILIRHARMNGYNACWVPGTDHASIATEAKVVQMLREQGVKKSSLSRDEFLGRAWEWKEKYGGIILEQLKRLGFSLDWQRTTFTMDDHYYDAVISVFIELYEKGIIYRGKRMINWDVAALTALSDEEVERRETAQKLFHLRYRIDADATTPEYITIATVRPETIMGDTAIAVHPDDDRYKHLHGKFAIVPLINRRIPIITDDYVTREFGTGALKVTPAHDMNDYQLGQKHHLDVIDIFNDDGTLNTNAEIFIGLERFEARKQIVLELEEKGHIVRTEDYSSEVGYSERTSVVVEPRLSMQWWVSMKDLASPALKSVMDEEINFYPAKFKNLYKHWMENIKDWCISRQLWWGHRIPAWYDEQGRYVVASDAGLARIKYQQKYSEEAGNLTQDEDCLDTWFSSWLWPFEVFKGYSKPGNKEFAYYYPTQTLVTAPEIIFFWVARMIMAGEEFTGKKPFESVYFTGIVRDKQGRKMSKSLGNSPDLLKLIDQYGADATRFGVMIASPAGNDILFDESALEQGRNFNNKIWNALKLVKMWESRLGDDGNAQTQKQFAVTWFQERLNQVKADLRSMMLQFRLSEGLKTIYSLVWDDFCSCYLEWIKPGFTQQLDHVLYQRTIEFFTSLLELLHPYMPFVTEEVYHALTPRSEDLCIRQQTTVNDASPEILETGALLKEIISTIRDLRNKQQLKSKDEIEVWIETKEPARYQAIESILKSQINCSILHFGVTVYEGNLSLVIRQDRFTIRTEKEPDRTHEKTGMEKELLHLKNFLHSVEKKLGNEKFVNNARPEVIANEQKKKSDTEIKIRLIEQSLASV